VAAGRVAFADRYDDYGLTVILDHGDHYYSLYANLRSTEVRAGDGLPSGGRIGMVGGDGTHGTALYFELRHKASTLDPSPWLGI
jgi:septal ring factor EnvC (AmiA/AmiB activator)